MKYFEKQADWPFATDEDSDLPFYKRQPHPSAMAGMGIFNMINSLALKKDPPNFKSKFFREKVGPKLWMVPFAAGAATTGLSLLRWARPSEAKEQYDFTARYNREHGTDFGTDDSKIIQEFNKRSSIDVEPWGVEKVISAPNRLMGKIILGSGDVSVRGPEEIKKPTRKAIKELEKKVDGLQVYVGGSPVKEQLKRVWEGKGTVFNQPLLRPLGLVGTLVGALQGKLQGGDYYNPASHSAVVRSNVPSVAAHEIGHAHDWSTIKYPLTQTVANGVIPGFFLYPEYKASKFAYDNLKTDRKSLKTLIPAYGTYVAAALGQYGLRNNAAKLGILGAAHLLKERINFE